MGCLEWLLFGVVLRFAFKNSKEDYKAPKKQERIPIKKPENKPNTLSSASLHSPYFDKNNTYKPSRPVVHYEYMTEDERLEKVTKERERTTCYFKDGITKEEFDFIAKKIAKRMKRINSCVTTGLLIKCNVESQTGYSDWNFKIDFNNWGHVTGKYWVQSNNEDSNIPYHYAKNVSIELKKIMSERKINLEDYSFIVNKNKNIGRLNGLSYISTDKYKNNTFLRINWSAEDFYKEHLYLVISLLKDKGFNNINSIPIFDIDSDNRDQLYAVEKIVINGVDDFKREALLFNNAAIKVYYHEKK